MSRRRKKTYRARLKDDKINTAVERKIAQIAKKEDIKSRNKIIRTMFFGEQNAAQGQDQVFQSAYVEFEDLTPNVVADRTPFTGLLSNNITAFGGVAYNYPNLQSVDVDTNVQQKFRVTKCQAFLQFTTESDYPATIRASFIYIPNANAYTANNISSPGLTKVLIPTQQIAGVRDQNNKGLLRDLQLNQVWDEVDYTNIRHTVLASKQIVVKPPVSAGGGGASQTMNKQGYSYHNINLSYTFKGRGKSFVYNGEHSASSQNAMSNGNIYLCIAHNAQPDESVPQVRGAGAIQFYAEKPTQSSPL